MLWLLTILTAFGAPRTQEVPVPWDPTRVLNPWPEELPERRMWTWEEHQALRDKVLPPLLPVDFSEEEEDEEVDPDRWNEIVVWGERVAQARRAIRDRLQSMGYKGKRRDGGTEWVPRGKENRWKTHVFIDDDGWYELSTPTVTPYSVQLSDMQARAPQAVDAPAFQRMPQLLGPQATFRVAGKRVRMQAERRTSSVVHPLVTDLRNALADEATSRTLGSVADTLDALWFDGIGYYGEHLDTRDERVDALLDLWATRTQTSAGEAVRRQVGDYLVEEVLPEHRVDPQRIEAAESRCGCQLR